MTVGFGTVDITVQEDVGRVMIPVVLEDPVATLVTVDIEYVFDTAGSNGKTLHYSIAYSICMLCIWCHRVVSRGAARAIATPIILLLIK